MPRTLPSLLLLICLANLAACGRVFPPPASESPEHWANSARDDMAEAERAWRRLRYSAKSAIVFIGDGMGVSTVTAGRILKGQMAGRSGEEESLTFDKFDHVGLSKTYSADKQTSDSASTATAFLCGVKANDRTIGVNQGAVKSSCSDYNPEKHAVKSLLRLANEMGRSVGVVTTTRITHATPAGAYAHTVSRSWEDDTERNMDVPDIEDLRNKCPDIATQLVQQAVNFTVLLGGGRLKFLPNATLTVDHAANKTVKGHRSDGVNLVSAWKQRQASYGRRHKYVETTEELLAVNPDDTDSLLGLLATDHLRYNAENEASEYYKEPTLAQMTEKALQMLMRNPNGFVLLVEGGRIDHGHHGNLAQFALRDLVAFDDAVGVADRVTSVDDTLIVVTADHSHVFTLGHYGVRGQSIVERRVSDASDSSKLVNGVDGMPFTVVNYADGPSAVVGAGRRNISDDILEGVHNYRYQSLIPRGSESHGGEDVGIFARGPGAQLFRRVHEQSYVAHAVMKAACIGWYAENRQCLERDGNAAGFSAASVAVAAAAAVASATSRFL